MPCTIIPSNACNPVCGSQNFLGIEYSGTLYTPDQQGNVDIPGVSCCTGQPVILRFLFESNRDDVSIDGNWVASQFPNHVCYQAYGGPLNPCVDLSAVPSGNWSVVGWTPQLVPTAPNTYYVLVAYTPTDCQGPQSNVLYVYPVDRDGTYNCQNPVDGCCQITIPFTINTVAQECFDPCQNALNLIQDCENLVTVNGNYLEACSKPCLQVNDVLNVSGVVNFPKYYFGFTPNGNPNCYTSDYPGDWTGLFIPGSYIFGHNVVGSPCANSSCFNGYIIETSSYDENTNITTVCFESSSPVILDNCSAPVVVDFYTNPYPCKTLASVNDAPWVGLFMNVTGATAGTILYTNANLTTFFVAGTTFDLYDSALNTVVANVSILTSTFNGANTLITYTINSGALSVNDNYFATNFTLGVGAVINCLPCLPQKCRRFTKITLTNTDSSDVIVETTIEDINSNFVNVLNWIYNIVDLGNYTLEVTSYDCLSSKTCTYNFNVCYNYSLKKTGCHTYRLEDNQVTPTKVNTVTITNIDNTYNTILTFDTQYSNFVDIVLPGDGIYTVTVTNNLVPPDSVTFPIYDFCDLYKCYKKLFLDVYCNDTDPCCNLCNSQQLEEYRKKRYELEKLLALAGTLFAYIFKNTIDAYGVMILTGAEEMSLTEINVLYNRVKQIIDRCGECSKIIVNKPCTNCGQ